MATVQYDPELLNDVLPIYYKRLFPFDLYYKWLSYGNVPKNYFSNREFSFTMKDDIYIRYQSFGSQKELEHEICSKAPHKIDIGAVYNCTPKEHRNMDQFRPEEKEVVIDIDITDYDEVRTCCQGGDICQDCWPLMAIAVKILDGALRDNFGFEHLLWVFSGRRGVHCWICDPSARKMTSTARSAIVGYLSHVKGGQFQCKKVQLGKYKSAIKPTIRKALDIIEPYFEDLMLDKQKILESKEQCNNLVRMALGDITYPELLNDLLKCKGGTRERWRIFEAHISKLQTRNYMFVIEEVKLQLCYPRLDVNVTKGLNHLLKGPFCVHPKTGQIAVPIEVQMVDEFNPKNVVNISSLLAEIDDYDKMNPDQTKIKDYKKTGLQYSHEIFYEFLKNMESTYKGKLLDESDMKMEF